MRSVSFAPVTLVFASLALAAWAGGCRTLEADRHGGVRDAPWSMRASKPAAETILGNGLRVVVEENHVAPVVAVAVWVSAGAADDPPALAGAAHFYEHLLFRGSKRRAPGAAAREIEMAGGVLGAWTGVDQTVYYVVVAPPFFDLALDVLSDAIGSPSFQPAEIERTRGLVLDEIRAQSADPGRRASEALFATAFAGHGYGRPVLGTAASVSALTPAALVSRFSNAYVGSAITVVVVGDVAPDAAAAVGRSFAALTRGKAGPVGANRGAISTAAAHVALTTTAARQAEIVLGFRTGALRPEDAAAIDLLAAVLARGEGSRLPRDLVRNRQLAETVRPSTFHSSDAGLAAFAITPAPRRTAEAAEAATDQILRLAAEPPTAEEVEAARTAVEGDLARGEEGPLGRARRLGFASAIAGDVDFGKLYRAHLRALGPDDLQASARKFLRVEALTIAVAVPDGRPAGRDETEAALRPRLEAMIAAAEGRARRVSPASPTAKDGDVFRFVAASGARLVVLRDLGAPLVSVEAAWAVGGDADGPPADAAALLAALLGRGTRTRSAADVRARMLAAAGGLSGFVSPAALGLRAEFLPRASEQGLAIVADCLLHPSFPEDDLDAERRALVARIATAARSPDAGARAAWRLFAETLWPDRLRRSDADAVPAFTRVRLLDYYRRNYPFSRLAVAVVGDVDPARVAATFGAELARPTAVAPPPAVAPPATTAVLAAQPTIVSRTAGTGAADAVVGYPTFPPGDPDRAPMELLAEILGGEGGRLAAALRDDKTLACRVAGRAAGAVEPGYLAVALSCSPGQLDPAVAVARAVLARVATAGVSADEVARAARRLAGTRAVALGTRASIADALALDEAYGLPPLSYRRHAAALGRVRVDDVARAVRRALDPKREVVALVTGAGS